MNKEINAEKMFNLLNYKCSYGESQYFDEIVPIVTCVNKGEDKIIRVFVKRKKLMVTNSVGNATNLTYEEIKALNKMIEEQEALNV